MNGRPAPVARGARAFVVVAALALLGACGLPEDDRARAIAADRIPLDLNPADSGNESSGPQTALLFLVDESGALTTVERQVPDDTLTAVLDALIAGPNADELARALRSNIPQDTDVVTTSVTDGIATIDLSGAEGGINSVQGPLQLSAYAQLVLTAVALDEVDAVRFLIDGRPVDVPNDGPPTRQPVSDADYASLQPLPPSTTAIPPRNGAGFVD